ncbi:Asp-tRNA(Asn)/Glu-tRNA(Gln) amidotransferase subunit GatA [Candidatus Pacearchaeota archaeon]|nr:Asp-tRNA(Asn)/Glu-tRNA(Gln) amidotransferase subunit GatA [Candidatus Pacearchaeota archaeon]
MNAETKVKKYLDAIRKGNKKLNIFLHVNDKALEEAKAVDKKSKKGRLHGYVFGIKSNINVKGMICNCGSKVLEDYRAPYDATVIEKIRKEDGIIIGMLNMDEFACGSSGESSAYGATQNPRVPGKIPGGSSSGSAAAVAAGLCDVALGSDTGGSIRNPASYCGVVGVKPSYGLVSRYGLTDLSMSLDQIGTLANTVDEAMLVLDVIRGKDERDPKSVDSSALKIGKTEAMRIGVVRVSGVDKDIQKLVDTRVDNLKKQGFKVKEVEIKHIDLAVQTYYPLVYAEFFSGTRRFDGRRYGKKIDDACGEEVLRRILGGSEITRAEFTGKYYKRALEVKELITEEFKEVLKDVDCLIMPTCPGFPWKLGAAMKVEEVYASDALTIPANLAGICAVSIPAGTIREMPIGMQVMAGKGDEGKMFAVAKELSRIGL